MAVYKNKGNQKIPIYASDADGNPATGIASTITGRISLDGGTPQTLTNSQPSELSSSLAPGVYIFTLTSNETNCDMFVVSASSSQSGIDIKPVAAFTEPEIRQADIQAIASHTQSAANLKAACDGTTGFNLGNGQIVAASVTGNVGGSVNSVTSAVTVGAMNSNVITSSAIQDGAITASKIASAAITSAKFAADAITDTALASSAATEISAAVWDRQTSDLTVTGSVGKRVADNVDATISSRSTFNPSSQTVTVGAMNANTITSTAIQDGAITSGKFATDAITDTALAASAATEISAAVWDRQTSALTVTGSVGKRVADNVDATISSRSTFNPSSQTVTVGAMNSNTITSTAIQDNAITSAKIANDAKQSIASYVWNALTSVVTEAQSLGKWILDRLNDTITSRLAASSYTAPDNAGIAAIKAKTDNLPSNPAAQTKLDDIHSMMEFQSGTPGYWRYKSSALETTPSGSGGATPEEIWSYTGGSGRTLTGAVTVGAMNSNVITASAIQDGAITANKLASGAITAAKFAADAIDSSALAASAATEVAAAVWDRQTSALNITGSVGKRVVDNLDTTVSSRSTFNPSSQTVTVGAMNANTITSSSIEDGAITANKIANAAITSSKFASGAIDATAIASDAIQASKIQNGAITSAKFATDAITDTVLAASAATEVSAAVWDRLTANITTPNSIGKRVVDNLDATVSSRSTFNPGSQSVTVGAMNANTITSTAIQDGAIIASKIASDAIQASKIQDGAITASKIATDAIQASKIQDGAITAAKIASNAITSAKIATDAITADKISSDAVSEIQSGLATDGHLTTVETMVGAVQSDLDTLSGKFDEVDEDVYEKVGTPAYRRLRKRALEEAPKGYKTW